MLLSFSKCPRRSLDEPILDQQGSYIDLTLSFRVVTGKHTSLVAVDGRNPLALFTECRTDFVPVPALEFTVAQIKAVDLFYKVK